MNKPSANRLRTAAGRPNAAIGASFDRVSRGTAAFAWLVLILMLLPSFVVIPMSFGDRNEFVFPPQGLSLFLYEQFFFESTWMANTVQSFKVAILSTVLCVVLGVGAAFGVVRGRFRGKQWLTLFMLSPMLIPVIVIALGLYIYFALIGISGTTTAIVIGHTLHGTPFVIVFIMAALRHVDPNLEAAAMIMGAGRLYTLFKVTLPQLKPALIASSVFAFLLSFDEVIIALFVSGRDTKTLPIRMFENLQFEISPVLAAISVLLMLLGFGAGLTAVMYDRSKEGRAVGSQRGD